MAASRPSWRLLLLAPSFLGADGISRVAATALSALIPVCEDLAAWSLHDGADALRGVGADTGASLAGARGRRGQFVAWMLMRALADRGRAGVLVFTLHLHLAPAAWPLLLRGGRLVVFLHGVEAWARLSGLRAAALARADLLIANSHHTCARFRAANPRLASLPVVVCPLGVGEAPPAHQPWPDPPGFVLIVGRLTEGYKGHDELLEVWPRLLRTHPGARLVVAGDGPERPRLEARAQALGLQGAVRFAGRVPEEDLPALYDACAFFAMPSLGEGFGLVFLEAMRAGKACIGGPGGPEEVVLDGETGLIVDPRQPEALLGALRRLLGDPAGAARMGAAGLARWRERFTAEAFVGRLRAALDLPAGQGR
ncbi:MAG: glycosyltransferase family 4 protein [Planctomycetota bacterium]|nr:glycosyltransferase family 4 protein [Planctomycetota bacterium]